MNKRERSGKFMELWTQQCHSATPEQKREIALAYLFHVLGLEWTLIYQFEEGLAEAQSRIGTFQGAGLEQPTPETLRYFWNKIREIFPDKYTESDVAFLAEQGKFDAVFGMLFYLNFKGPICPLLNNIIISAHAYK
jgi:hypothetical protein